MQQTPPIRFGALGASRIARKAALPAIVASPLAELVMVGSREREKAQVFAQEFNCDAGTYDEVLARPDIDAVYISLPAALHAEWSVKALNAGKHVWCEKPAALSYKEALAMTGAAKRSGKRLLEGFMFLYHPQHAKVKELVQSGALGEPLLFSGCFSFPMPPDGANLLNATLGGGTYNDMAVYPIRASRMIFDAEPEEIFCKLYSVPGVGVDVRADVLLSYPGGRQAHASALFGGSYRSTYNVLGTKAYLELDLAYAVPKDKETRIVLESNGAKQELTIPAADQFGLMLESFCREIRLGEASTKRYEEDLLAQARVLEAGRLSQRESRAVPLSDIQ